MKANVKLFFHYQKILHYWRIHPEVGAQIKNFKAQIAQKKSVNQAQTFFKNLLNRILRKD